MKAKIRKLVVQVDETLLEMGKAIEPPGERVLEFGYRNRSARRRLR